ncbi:MAG: hypothetical protein IRZ16_24190 [Myxococcaceae bacterium]|nr:hypothetical protein [Myxococcaceae bacterium]
MGSHLYKARAFGVVAAVLVAAAAWGAETVGGVTLPSGSHKVAENRYRAPGDFDATMDFFKKAYPPGAYPRKSIVNQPGVKAVHIVNPTGKNWEGLNIYESADGVRIFVLRPSATKK